MAIIENDKFPFEFLSSLAERESWRKEIHRPIYHVHKWWAKRLGSVFHGIVLGCLLQDDCDLTAEFHRTHHFAGRTVFDPYNTRQAMNYGFRVWRDFFNDRQLLALGLLRRAIRSIADDSRRRALSTLFSGVLEFNNLFASYKGEETGAVRHMFSHHILKPERMPIEANVWGTPKSSGSFSNLFRGRLLRALDYRRDPTELALDGASRRVCSPAFSETIEPAWPALSAREQSGEGSESFSLQERLYRMRAVMRPLHALEEDGLPRPLPGLVTGQEAHPPVAPTASFQPACGIGEGAKGRLIDRGIYLSCGTSSDTGLADGGIDLVVTDPPFFDNVHYSELADFFHAWQQLDGELAGDPTSTRSAHEVQDTRAEQFAVKLSAVFRECHRILRDDGLLVFTYHHSRDDGWQSLAEAILGAGFTVINSQPVKSEMSVATPKSAAGEKPDMTGGDRRSNQFAILDYVSDIFLTVSHMPLRPKGHDCPLTNPASFCDSCRTPMTRPSHQRRPHLTRLNLR